MKDTFHVHCPDGATYEADDEVSAREFLTELEVAFREAGDPCPVYRLEKNGREVARIGAEAVQLCAA